MEETVMTIRLNPSDERRREAEISVDLQSLLHPAGAFSHPSDVVRDPELTLSEKRAILASWASDACAVESAPALRLAPAGSRPVTFDDVMDALRVLDQHAGDYNRPHPHYRRVLAERVSGVFGRKPARGGNRSPQPGA
jgi:hypothetical protein